MATYSIDTAKAIDNLVENGVQEKQARAIVETFSLTQDDLASKHDLDAAVNAITKELNEKFSEVHLEFAKIDTKFARLRVLILLAIPAAAALIKAIEYLISLFSGSPPSQG